MPLFAAQSRHEKPYPPMSKINCPPLRRNSSLDDPIRRTPLEYQNPPHDARRIFVKAQFCRVMHSAVMHLEAVVKPANGSTNRV